MRFSPASRRDPVARALPSSVASTTSSHSPTPLCWPPVARELGSLWFRSRAIRSSRSSWRDSSSGRGWRGYSTTMRFGLVMGRRWSLTHSGLTRRGRIVTSGCAVPMPGHLASAASTACLRRNCSPALRRHWFMPLREEFERTGQWLFRWRSYLPLLLFPPVVAALHDFTYLGGSHALDLGSCVGRPLRLRNSRLRRIASAQAAHANAARARSLRTCETPYMPQGTASDRCAPTRTVRPLNRRARGPWPPRAPVRGNTILHRARLVRGSRPCPASRGSRPPAGQAGKRSTAPSVHALRRGSSSWAPLPRRSSRRPPHGVSPRSSIRSARSP